MTKLGDEYQTIVGLVRSAIDPAASVKIGQWVEGPDGRRDIDVEVRGCSDNLEHFILVECKDWNRPVGIETVDALDSKRRDLGADLAVIYSNSGFTEPALRKARRIGVQAFSALKQTDKRIRVTLAQELIVKALSVQSYTLRFYFRPEVASLFPEQWDPLQVTILGLHLVNWLHAESGDLLRSIESSTRLVATYEFRAEQEIMLGTQAIPVKGIEVTLTCVQKWLSQEVQTDVTLGHYDHLTRTIAIPDKEAYFFGPVDQDRWQEVDYAWPDEEPKPNSFRLHLTLLRPIVKVGDGEPPDLGPLIASKNVRSVDPDS